MPIIASVGSVTIANAGTNSTPFDIAGAQNITLFMPTPWTAATLDIQIQREGDATWYTLGSVAGPYVVTVAAGAAITLSTDVMIPNSARSMRLVSSVAQGGERTIGVERRSLG